MTDEQRVADLRQKLAIVNNTLTKCSEDGLDVTLEFRERDGPKPPRLMIISALREYI